MAGSGGTDSSEKDPVIHEMTEDRLSDFTRDRRLLVLMALALPVGIISALVADFLVWLIGIITNLVFYQSFSSTLRSPAEHALGAWIIGIPVFGGLIIGLMARFGSEKIRGHGIPEALEAILMGSSRMDPKVALLKPLSSALSIGTGGPFGAEGPIIMTGGAFGSLFAQFFNLSSAERKTLLVAGAAGGMSAIFATPVGAVLLAVELLLFEWKPRSLIPVAIASAVAGVLRVPLLGPGPMFPVFLHPPMHAEGVLIAFLVGILAGLVSCVLTLMVYGSEDLFRSLPIHWMWWPAIGCLVVGIGGWFNPKVLGVGYDVIHALLRGEFPRGAMVGLLIGKAIVWAIALGSGTSGGILAPLLMIGGALGGLEAFWIPMGDPGLWATISMAAVMGGTMGAPLTAIVFTLELTQDLNILSGLLAGCIGAHAVALLVMRRSILTEKVARRGLHIAREYSVDQFEVLRVGEVMERDVPTIPATLRLSELSERIARGDARLSARQGTPIMNEEGKLVGIITRGDMVRALARTGDPSVLEAGSRDLIVAYPDEVLRDALAKMLTNDIGRLPVVSRYDAGRLLGYLGRSSILAARLKGHREETVRDSGWLSRRPR